MVVNASDNGSPPLSGTTSFTVDVAPLAGQQITALSAVSAIGTFGGTASLTATLTERGVPLAGKSIGFTLTLGSRSVSLGRAVTNAKGVAILNGVVLPGVHAGTTSDALEASYGGDPTDSAALGSGRLSIALALPTVSWASPENVTFGTALGPAQLDASASVAGTFIYTPAAGTVLKTGLGQILSLVFNPVDATDYQAVTLSTSINVLAPTPISLFDGEPPCHQGQRS